MQISSDDRILIVAPHPDDECIGCGGILIKYSGQCDVCVLTDGASSNADVSKSEMARLRAAEFRKEMKLLGVNNFFMMGYSDSLLLYEPKCCYDLDFGLYSKIFLPMQDDWHYDHVAAFCYAMNAIRKQRIDGADIYQYEVQTPLDDTDDYLDISEIIEDKIALIRNHDSQMALYDYAEWVRELDGNHAINYEIGADYTEIYKKTSIAMSIHEQNMLELAKLRQRVPLHNAIMKKWLINSISENAFGETLLSTGIRTIAIFGYGDLGELFYFDVKSAGIKVMCIIDNKNTGETDDGIPFVKQNEFSYDVDLIVITVLSTYDSIKASFMKMGYRKVVSIYDLLEKGRLLWE